jgi:alkylation response protein AidB-like acyl-CoA dehydrogenase
VAQWRWQEDVRRWARLLRTATSASAPHGRWSFASGAQHADLFLAHCVVPDGGAASEDDGAARLRRRGDRHLARVGNVRTGSHDFTVDDVFVPEDRSFTVFEEQPGATTLARLPG